MGRVFPSMADKDVDLVRAHEGGPGLGGLLARAEKVGMHEVRLCLIGLVGESEDRLTTATGNSARPLLHDERLLRVREIRCLHLRSSFPGRKTRSKNSNSKPSDFTAAL